MEKQSRLCYRFRQLHADVFCNFSINFGSEPPRITEDYFETDLYGRHISVKAIRPVLIRYWLDGPADELRVIRLTIVKPWSG